MNNRGRRIPQRKLVLRVQNLGIWQVIGDILESCWELLSLGPTNLRRALRACKHLQLIILMLMWFHAISCLSPSPDRKGEMSKTQGTPAEKWQDFFSFWRHGPGYFSYSEKFKATVENLLFGERRRYSVKVWLGDDTQKSHTYKRFQKLYRLEAQELSRWISHT